MISKDTSVKQGASVQKYKHKGMKKSRKIRQFVCRIRILEWRDSTAMRENGRYKCFDKWR